VAELLDIELINVSEAQNVLDSLHFPSFHIFLHLCFVAPTVIESSCIRWRKLAFSPKGRYESKKPKNAKSTIRRISGCCAIGLSWRLVRLPNASCPPQVRRSGYQRSCRGICLSIAAR
jgi:hypothetical protein